MIFNLKTFLCNKPVAKKNFSKTSLCGSVFRKIPHRGRMKC
jgi:hypothetical protein